MAEFLPWEVSAHLLLAVPSSTGTGSTVRLSQGLTTAYQRKGAGMNVTENWLAQGI